MAADQSPKGKIWATLGAVVLAILGSVVAVEGGYVNNPADPGGETNHGITVQVARDNGYQGPMRELPLAVAEDIYTKSYIETPNFHRVIAMSPAVGKKLVDVGVNAGQARAARWFQVALNHLSRGGADFQQVEVDGQVGNQSLAAYKALERKRGRIKACELVLKLVDAQQGAHYMSLNKPMFIVGWADNRLGNVPLATCADSVQGSTS